jgi:hypothetical protein
MVCVINPDGTITCSDGDERIAADLVKNASTQGGKAWRQQVMNVDDQAAKVLSELKAKSSPTAVILVNGTDLGWSKPRT